MTYLVTFHSHFDAILTNRTLKSAGLEVQLMPVPRTVSASCGTCVTFPLREGERAPENLGTPVKVEHIYRKTETGWERVE